MSDPKWEAVDSVICDALLPEDPALSAALSAARAAGLPAINVAPNQGKLLALLALAKGARRILEIGTLGGYSTIWLARALPEGGRLVSLELEPEHARVAGENLARAGVDHLVEIRVGPASASLERLAAEAGPPFDMVFIDADKDGYPDYLERSLRLTAPGSLIVADNVVRGGALADPDPADPLAVGVRRFIEALGAEERVTATAVQTVGSKGYDGFALAIVR